MSCIQVPNNIGRIDLGYDALIDSYFVQVRQSDATGNLQLREWLGSVAAGRDCGGLIHDPGIVVRRASIYVPVPGEFLQALRLERLQGPKLISVERVTYIGMPTRELWRQRANSCRTTSCKRMFVVPWAPPPSVRACKYPAGTSVNFGSFSITIFRMFPSKTCGTEVEVLPHANPSTLELSSSNRRHITNMNMSMPVPDLPTIIESIDHALTVAELAPLLGVAGSTLYKGCKRQTIPHFYVFGAIRFDPATTASWLRSNTIRAGCS